MHNKVIPNQLLFADVRQLLEEGTNVTINTKGQSMLPFIHGQRDQVVLQKTENVEVGDILLCEISREHYVMHRLVAVHGEHLRLMGDGNCYATEQCFKSDVLGKVIYIIRPDGKKIDCTSSWERCKASLWNSLRFMRRYLLAIYKRI